MDLEDSLPCFIYDLRMLGKNIVKLINMTQSKAESTIGKASLLLYTYLVETVGLVLATSSELL